AGAGGNAQNSNAQQAFYLKAFRLSAPPTLLPLRVSNSWLSTGWFTMTIALELCDRINVYGMVAPDFCREPQQHSVPYHYYEPRGPDECAMYISHERGRRGSHHRFITEKRVFAKWARTFDIHFYQPDWTPPPLPANQTLEATATAAPLVPQKT
ncbi:hypothetical protein KUCAC02_018460, partial [Chaenocephalus aceratus]